MLVCRSISHGQMYTLVHSPTCLFHKRIPIRMDEGYRKHNTWKPLCMACTLHAHFNILGWSLAITWSRWENSVFPMRPLVIRAPRILLSWEIIGNNRNSIIILMIRWCMAESKCAFALRTVDENVAHINYRQEREHVMSIFATLIQVCCHYYNAIYRIRCGKLF